MRDGVCVPVVAVRSLWFFLKKYYDRSDAYWRGRWASRPSAAAVAVGGRPSTARACAAAGYRLARAPSHPIKETKKGDLPSKRTPFFLREMYKKDFFLRFCCGCWRLCGSRLRIGSSFGFRCWRPKQIIPFVIVIVIGGINRRRSRQRLFGRVLRANANSRQVKVME